MGRWIRLRTKERAGPEQRAPVDDRTAHFAMLYEEYVDSIYRYCRLRIDDPSEAEDAAALVFTKAFAAFAAGADTSFRSWLFAIAHNVVIDHYRSRTGRRIAQPLDHAREVIDPAATPEDIASLAEERQAIRDALTQLPADQRRVVELRLAGLTGPEIADVLDRSHGAVKMLQLRAINRLRELLAPPAHQHLQDQTEEIGHGSRVR